MLTIGEFPDDWAISTIGAIAQVTSGGTPDRTAKDFWDGDIPWITTGKIDFGIIEEAEEYITVEGLNSSAAKIFPKGTILMAMYGQGATRGKVAILGLDAATNQACAALLLKEDIAIKEFVFYYLTFFYQHIRELGHGGNQKNLNAGLIKEIKVPLPSFSEQRRIVDILSTWDRAIDLTSQLIAAKQQYKRGLTQQLLTGKRRFKQFARSKEIQDTEIGPIPADWNYVSVGQIAHQVSERNAMGLDLPVLSCTKYGGLVDSLSYFGRQIFSEDTSTYKIVRRHQFAYATNHIEEGSIGYQDLYDEALISPMYTVFKTNSNVDDRFLYALLKTEAYRQIFERNTSASVNRRGSLRWNEFSRIKVPLPSVEEQQAIVEVLDTCDQELALLKNKLKLLKKQKQGLMQQLLTGKVRVKV